FSNRVMIKVSNCITRSISKRHDQPPTFPRQLSRVRDKLGSAIFHQHFPVITDFKFLRQLAFLKIRKSHFTPFLPPSLAFGFQSRCKCMPFSSLTRLFP